MVPLKDAALAAVRLAERLPAGFADTQQMEAALTGQEALSLTRTDSGAGVAPPLSTAFGGIFLLLPHLDELPLPEATRGWPNTDEAAAISLVRWLVLLKCCGRQNSERAFYDPLLRDLLLIPPTLSPAALRTWQARLKPEHLQSFLAALFEWQWSRGAIEGKEQLLAVAPRVRRVGVSGFDRRRARALVGNRYLPAAPAAKTYPIAALFAGHAG